MKITNKFTILFSIVTLSTALITQTYYADSYPDLEIFNKSNLPIYVKFTDLDKDTEIKPGKTFETDLFQKGRNGIAVYITTKVRSSDTTSPFFTRKFTVAASSNPNRTIYLSWDPTKSMPLYPQTGPLMGLAGKYQHYIPGAGSGTTKSGYKLNNNVTENEIQENR